MIECPVKYCKECAKEGRISNFCVSKHNIPGLQLYVLNESMECPLHKIPYEVLNISSSDADNILSVSPDEYVLRSMAELHTKDSIEYGLKLAQFKNLATEKKQMQKIEEQRQNEENNRVRCPRCGSTQITTGQRGWNWFWGPIGSGNARNRCARCGKVWSVY